MLGSESADLALEAFGLLRQRLGTDVTAFELISSDAMALVLEHLGRQTSPLPTTHPWYVLVEMSSTSSQGGC
ncbi:FAD-linked oxidase C-terminal domain-containing protein [Cupriavidus basilensis]